MVLLAKDAVDLIAIFGEEAVRGCESIVI